MKIALFVFRIVHPQTQVWICDRTQPKLPVQATYSLNSIAVILVSRVPFRTYFTAVFVLCVLYRRPIYFCIRYCDIIFNMKYFFISHCIFTVRRSALHGLCDRNSVRPSVRLSVRPSVCLSHSWTVSTWFDLRSSFLHHRVAPSF